GLISFFFFFSSRRRHTRWPRDWSSDVCSSDLLTPLAGDAEDVVPGAHDVAVVDRHRHHGRVRIHVAHGRAGRRHLTLDAGEVVRSEERRVGKEWRTRWVADVEEKKAG